jgi:hypothetical protein
MAQSVENKVLSRIYGRGRGTAVIPSDFLDLGSRAAVDKALSRLAARGVIRRVRRGIYEYPKVSKRLGPMSPSLPEVAKAVARKQGAQLQTSGARNANALGLSPQVPAQATYLTSGRSTKIKVGHQNLSLKHVVPARVIRSGSTATAVIEALRFLGKQGVTDDTIRKLSRTLSKADKKALLNARRRAPAWMHPFFERIAS